MATNQHLPMKIAVFSTKSYDQEYFEKYANDASNSFSFFETALTKDTANLSIGFDVICVFVNDNVDKNTIEILSKNGIKLIALRCAGYNNVDIEAAKNNHIKVVRVPAYSPEAVSEHAVALILSLHCPLNSNTKHIINKASIALMKEGVMIINTSRGALINTVDVIQGLSSKKIGYLGIDVYEQEENLFFEDFSERIIPDDLLLRLNSFPNVLITSHQAFFTKEAMAEITTTTLDNIKAFEKNQELVNEVK